MLCPKRLRPSSRELRRRLRPCRQQPPACKPHVPVFELLIIAALVLGVVGLFLNRSVRISDTVFQFNEMSSGTQSDVMVMLLTLATAVPLFLGKHPVEQRFVLAGLAVSTFLFEVPAGLRQPALRHRWFHRRFLGSRENRPGRLPGWCLPDSSKALLGVDLLATAIQSPPCGDHGRMRGTARCCDARRVE